MTGSTRTAILLPLWVLGTIATLYFLRSASQLLIPIVLAVLISYVLEPVVDWLERLRLPRTASASALLLAVLGLGVWGIYSLRDDVRAAVGSLPEVAATVRQYAASVLEAPAASSVRQAVDQLSPGADDPRAMGESSGGRAGSMPFFEGLTHFVQQGVQSLATLAGNITVIFFLVFFLIVSAHDIAARIIDVAGPDEERRRTMQRIVNDINAQIRRFLVVRLITAVLVGAATWGILTFFGTQNPAVWGILAGICNSIPYFGPIIVSGGLLIIGIAQGGGLAPALQMSGAALIVTSLEGWLLTPFLMGKAGRMSAIAVFLGLLLWTWVWGVWGTILAVPMLVIVKSVADQAPPLRPLGRLMAP